MGLRHGSNGWTLKDENMDDEEEALARSLSASFRPNFEFEKHMIRHMHSLSILFTSQFNSINKDIDAIKEKLNIQNSDDGSDENEEVDENDEDNVLDECDDDILLGDMIYSSYDFVFWDNCTFGDKAFIL